jgi:hypothetical protein
MTLLSSSGAKCDWNRHLNDAKCLKKIRVKNLKARRLPQLENIDFSSKSSTNCRQCSRAEAPRRCLTGCRCRRPVAGCPAPFRDPGRRGRPAATRLLVEAGDVRWGPREGRWDAETRGISNDFLPS